MNTSAKTHRKIRDLAGINTIIKSKKYINTLVT